MFSPKFLNHDKDDLVSTVFSELKILGVKLPKLKKFKTSVFKSEKPVQESSCKIFGANLSDQEWVSNGEWFLPKFLAISTAYLGDFSKIEIGLFRKAGNVARQKKLRMKLEDGGSLKDSEPNDVASLLKQWLRELPEPLIHPSLQDLFIRCLNLEMKENCVTACLLICLLLPPEQLHTLKYLLNFLANIASNCNRNKMDSYNLALIMAPNIFVSHESSDKIRNSLYTQHTSILKTLIENCDKVGEIPSGVTFQYPSVYSELDSSSDVLDSNPNKSKKKVKGGPVQEMFIGFKKFVGQSNTPLSKNVTPEPFVESSACKRKVEPEQYLSAVKRLAVSKEDSDNHEPEVTPKRNGLLTVSRDKSARNHVRRKSIGALLRRKDKKSAKSSKLPSKESQPPLNITTVEIPIVNILDANAPVETKIGTDTKSICRSGSIKKSWSDCPLPSVGTEFSMLPVISTQTSEGCLSGRPNEPSLHNSKSESLTNNKDILFENGIRKDNLESKKRKSVIEEISKKEVLPNTSTAFEIPKKCSPNIEVNHGKNEIFNLDTRNIDSVTHSTFLRRSPRISASIRVSSSDMNADSFQTNNLDKEDILSESAILQKVGLPRQEAFIIKNAKKTSTKAISGLENLSSDCEELNPKKKIHKKRNSSFNGASTKQEPRSVSSKKSLRRKTRHGSLIRGQPNSVKSGLRLAMSRHYGNNSSFLLNSPAFKTDGSLLESPMLQSLDLSLSSLLQDFCLNSPKDLPEFTFDIGASPDENDSTTKLNICKSNAEEIQLLSPKVSEKITPLSKRPKRLSSKSDSKLQRKKTLSELKRSDSYTGKQFECKQTTSRKNSISPKSNDKVLSPSNDSPFSNTQVQELDCNLFKTPINKCCSPNSEVWVSGGTFFNSITSPTEEISNKRESIALILKNNTGHVQAKVNLYDNNVQRSDSKDSISNERILRSSQKSYSASKAKTPNFKSFDSSSKTSSVKSRMKYQRSPLPPPPKFTLTDFSMSPKPNHPLKEVTNFNLEVNDTKLVKSNTPIKSASPVILNTPNSDHKTKKTKRNSFSGHTPHKLSKKVSRSESSPACQRNVILRE